MSVQEFIADDPWSGPVCDRLHNGDIEGYDSPQHAATEMANNTIYNIHKSHIIDWDTYICFGQKPLLETSLDSAPSVSAPPLCLAYALLCAPWWDLAELTHSVSDDIGASSGSNAIVDETVMR